MGSSRARNAQNRCVCVCVVSVEEKKRYGETGLRTDFLLRPGERRLGSLRSGGYCGRSDLQIGQVRGTNLKYSTNIFRLAQRTCTTE